jgi:hypothetical protein
VTAIRARRTRSTVLAFLVALVSVAAVGVLAIAGVRTLADSTVGSLAEGQQVTTPIQRLPYTATALIGVVDEDGRLTSVAVGVLEPDGVGGSLVGFAASADAASGNSDVLVPLAAELQLSGPTAFREAAERMTGLSFDVIEIVDQPRFAQLVTPLGDLPATLPIPLYDSSTGEQWDAGEIVLSSAAAARAITARDESIADWYFEPGRAAVWDAIASRVGAGVGSVAPVASDRDLPKIATLDEFLKRLFAGPVNSRALSFVVIDDDRMAEQLSLELSNAFGPGAVRGVVSHNRSEMLMVLGAIAPGRLGAPVDAPTFRVISGYSDTDLDGLGQNRADVLKLSLDRLLYAGANIVAVVDLPGAGAPELTQIRVANPSVISGVRETYGDLFGTSEVTVAAVLTEGVDIEVELGRSYIEALRGETADVVAGSVGDASTDDEQDDTGG